MCERGVAAGEGPRHPHEVLGRACLARAGGGRGGAFGAAGEAQSMHLADEGVAGHISELGSDLAGRKPGLPELLQLFDAIVRPGQYRHRSLPFMAPALRAGRRDAKSAKNPCKQNPLSVSPIQNPLTLAERAFTRPNVYARHLINLGIRTAARDVVPDGKNATICRDSRARVPAARPHVPSLGARFSTAMQSR